MIYFILILGYLIGMIISKHSEKIIVYRLSVKEKSFIIIFHLLLYVFIYRFSYDENLYLNLFMSSILLLMSVIDFFEKVVYIKHILYIFIAAVTNIVFKLSFLNLLIYIRNFLIILFLFSSLYFITKKKLSSGDVFVFSVMALLYRPFEYLIFLNLGLLCSMFFVFYLLLKGYGAKYKVPMIPFIFCGFILNIFFGEYINALLSSI